MTTTSEAVPPEVQGTNGHVRPRALPTVRATLAGPTPPRWRLGARRRQIACSSATIALPADVQRLLIEHQETQDRERVAAGQLWEEHGFLFAGPTGRPIDPRADNREWSELLEEGHVKREELFR